MREVPFASGTIGVPVLGSLDIAAALLSLGSIVAIFRFKAGVLPVLAVCAALGAAYALFS